MASNNTVVSTAPATTILTTASDTPTNSPTTQASTAPSPTANTPTTADAPTSSAPPVTLTAPTQVIVTTPSSNNVALAPITVTLTSTSVPASTINSTPTTLATSASSSAADPSLATSSPSPTPTKGLSSSGKIAIAVVVPVVAVALIVTALLFLWRRRKQRKDAAELRRKEVEDYGFNPNNDPTLPAVGGVGGGGDQQMTEDSAGYRGWGATPMARKPSTNLSSGNGAIGMAVSDAGAGGLRTSPTPGAGSEAHSGDPLVNSPNRPRTADSETIGELGAAPVAGANRDMHRGASNASSSYSAGARSEGSAELPVPGAPHPANYYSGNDGVDDEPSYTSYHPSYGDGAHAGGQPVIRDLAARRNTRIENPAVIPQQGNAGIAQNF
ncbi:MAG: hypothetical protein M1832_003983 [Thelocarpon impressellum]|nr:MAG: hypothetical protein M1832_003983 [Thelocarpon impressellum]